MGTCRAAVYCRAESGDGNELRRQRQVLEQYGTSNGFDILVEYLDEGTGSMDLNNRIHFQMLCGAKQGVFDVLLVEKIDILPAFNEDEIPNITVHSVADHKTIVAGCSKDPIFHTGLEARSRCLLYYKK